MKGISLYLLTMVILLRMVLQVQVMRKKITAKTSLEIKKPKIGLPEIDENGTIISKGLNFYGSRSEG